VAGDAAHAADAARWHDGRGGRAHAGRAGLARGAPRHRPRHHRQRRRRGGAGPAGGGAAPALPGAGRDILTGRAYGRMLGTIRLATGSHLGDSASPRAFMQNSPMTQHHAVAERPETAPGAAAAPLIYEQPLNERMRTFLRLDYLYNQALYHNEKASQWGSRAAVASLIDILAILSRGDVRAEVLKEIERHLAQLESFANKPGVDA